MQLSPQPSSVCVLEGYFVIRLPFHYLRNAVMKCPKFHIAFFSVKGDLSCRFSKTCD